MAPFTVPGAQTSSVSSKELPHRPTLVRKRTANVMNEASGRAASSPNKRVKVSFDAEVEVRLVGDEWEMQPEVIRHNIRVAINRKNDGDRSIYEAIKRIYSSDSDPEDLPSPVIVKNHTVALLRNVSSLDRSCSDLVNDVLNSDWVGRDESYVALFIKFLGNLVSAQSGYIGVILEMLVDKFGQVPLASGQVPQFPVIKRSQMQSRAHTALRYVLSLIPSSSGILAPILATSFPFSSESTKAHVIYTKNLLKIISYAPQLRSDILALIIDRLVKIDVQVQVDLDDLEEEIGEDFMESISQLPSGSSEVFDDMDDDSDDESVSSDESVDDDAEKKKALITNIEKMDIIMDIMFEHYQSLFASASFEEKQNALDLLLRQFTTTILPTYRSRHAQFLVFHLSQTSPVLVERFTDTCASIITNKNRPSHLRQSAAAYLASFIARGARVSRDAVREMFTVLARQLKKLRLEYEPRCRGPDLRRYFLYYATAQALLYIFCFRWRDLVVKSDDSDNEERSLSPGETDLVWIPGVKDAFNQTIYSTLNPLKVCSPAIVAEFTRIAHHLRFLYLYPLLEKNKRLHLPEFKGIEILDRVLGQLQRETALSQKGDDQLRQLDAYFPFDPYNLPRSKRWIQDYYVEWTGIPGLDDEDEDGAESEDDDKAQNNDEK